MRNPVNLVAFALIAILTAVAVVIVWPSDPDRYLPDFFPWPKGQGIEIGGFERETMRLGLDLKGGAYMLLEGDSASLPAGADLKDAMEGARDVIERRINEFGVAETEIQLQGTNRLALQLPGIDPEEARQKIGRTALLQFMEPEWDETGTNFVCTSDTGETFTVPAQGTSITVDANGDLTLCVPPGSTVPTGSLNWIPAEGMGSDGQEKALTGRFLRGGQTEALPVGPTTGRPEVAIEFNSEGGRLFEQITTRLVGLPMAIFLDDELISAPTVNTVISGGQGVITGLDLDEARTLARQLRAGSMPIELRVIQESTVDATLGEDSVRHSVQAGIIGILAVMVFMILYYRLPGVLAGLALVTYTAVVLMIFKVWPVTLTLAGIAAFVLSVGMAVDANILVFERLKEELRSGRSLVTAIETGFGRAWTSIRDSNVSTLITCLILYWFGDQFGAALVKGFAITLAIGVLVSMFSAIVVTRTFLRLMVGTPLARRLSWFAPELGGRPRPVPAPSASNPGPAKGPTMLDFVQRRGLYYLLSLAILVVAAMALLVPPALKPGIEFSAGASMTFRFEQPVDQDDLRTALADIGHPEARVQKTGEDDFIIRMGELEGSADSPPVGPDLPSEREAIESALEDRFGAFVVRDFASVSEIVSREIGRNAAIAVVAAAAGVLLYISWAFRGLPRPWLFGAAAIIAALHDTALVVGAFSIFGKVFDTEINTMFITGLLTVIGFSVHDTIVVFDRIRENVTRNPGVAFPEVVNASLNETLARSINTSLTLVVTIVALLFLGGESIQDFLLVLLIGVVSGTYSSIFVASQILVSWEEGNLGRVFGRLIPRPAPAPGPGS